MPVTALIRVRTDPDLVQDSRGKTGNCYSAWRIELLARRFLWHKRIFGPGMEILGSFTATWELDIGGDSSFSVPADGHLNLPAFFLFFYYSLQLDKRKNEEDQEGEQVTGMRPRSLV